MSLSDRNVLALGTLDARTNVFLSHESDPLFLLAADLTLGTLAGEVLDIDAITGGFNLQAAWTTGVVAGQCAAGS